MARLVEWANKCAELHPSDGGRGLCERQGRILGVKYIRFRFTERTSVGYPILSDLFYMIFSGYY